MGRALRSLVQRCRHGVLAELVEHLLAFGYVAGGLLFHALLLLLKHAPDLVLLVLQGCLHEIAAAEFPLLFASANVVAVVEAVLGTLVLLLAFGLPFGCDYFDALVSGLLLIQLFDLIV